MNLAMMSNQKDLKSRLLMNNENSSGIGFFGLLTIVFIVLKLTDKIEWNWFLVLSPILIPFSIFLVIFIYALVVLFLVKCDIL